MIVTQKSDVNGRKRRKRHTILRPGITAACREARRSRWHVTEVLRGNREPSNFLRRILKEHGLEVKP
ncbi:MAG: hypothetical protein PHR35_04170 [Kiritimatiellae bacterium]|nr:hypothetical protein [Kiritimatiellia bacterium]